MRYLLFDEIANALDRGKSVEQFLGKGEFPDSISWIEIRPSDDQIELWFFEVEDVGDAAYTDIYSFPDTGNSNENPAGTMKSFSEAIDRAQQLFKAKPDQWVNQGVIESIYVAQKA
jgi:hypothetical protein